MAKDDLDASVREESVATRKRLATKLVPGPRERLRLPDGLRGPGRGQIGVWLPGRSDGSTPATVPAPIKQPRWTAPGGRPL